MLRCLLFIRRRPSSAGEIKIFFVISISRVYGDKATDIINGLKTCPNAVIPVVIERMQQKDSEWHDATRAYQRVWADMDSKNYLRSLDHQGAVFKARDAPFIRSKTMVSQIEGIAHNDGVSTLLVLSVSCVSVFIHSNCFCESRYSNIVITPIFFTR